jgi:hypothetical protein
MVLTPNTLVHLSSKLAVLCNRPTYASSTTTLNNEDKRIFIVAAISECWVFVAGPKTLGWLHESRLTVRVPCVSNRTHAT